VIISKEGGIESSLSLDGDKVIEFRDLVIIQLQNTIHCDITTELQESEERVVLDLSIGISCNISVHITFGIQKFLPWSPHHGRNR